MDSSWTEEKIFHKIKEIITKKKNDGLSNVDPLSITQETDIRQLDMDSLDLMEFRFALDEEFKVEIPDEDFENNHLTIIKHLVEYIKNI